MKLYENLASKRMSFARLLLYEHKQQGERSKCDREREFELVGWRRGLNFFAAAFVIKICLRRVWQLQARMPTRILHLAILSVLRRAATKLKASKRVLVFFFSPRYLRGK